jgi:hypothetical protein
MAVARILPLCIVLALCTLLALAGVASPTRAGDIGQPGSDCYWCTRDAIYERTKLIAVLEANPDVDEGIKGPQITTARAEIHALRATLGPPQWEWATPCCYTRRPIHIR